MKFAKILLVSIFLTIHLWLISSTIEVNQDGTGDFIVIQEAINSSSDGDTVLVHPGTYYENIDLNNHDITLCSLEATTSDSNYIATTIIDGNQSGSCIKIANGETVTIQGFSVTNGSGTYSTNIHRGGGIYTNNSIITLISCKIFNNCSLNSGGAYFRNSYVNLIGNTITENVAKGNAGGVTFWGETNVIFDETHRNSIFNNHAYSFQDILIEYYTGHMDIILDKISFSDPDYYYIGTKSNFDCSFSIDYLSYANLYIENDLYVAPWGCDENSGLSPNEPLQNINVATYYIKSDSLNPHTIYLFPGTYTPENQEFVISLKSHLTLQGQSKETTIIDGMEVDNVTTLIAYHTQNISIRDISFINCTAASIISGNYCGDITIDNVNISNGTGQSVGGIKLTDVGNVILQNVGIENCHSSWSTSLEILNSTSTRIDQLISKNNYCTIGSGVNGGNGVNTILVKDDFILTNSIFYNNKNLYYDDFFNSAANSTLAIGNSVSEDFINSWRIENCLFYENEALQNYYCGGGFTLTATTATNKGYFINNTVVNNSGMRTMFIGGLDTYVFNNVFYNNNFTSEGVEGYELCVPNTFQFMFHSNITFSNNIIKGGYDGYYDDYPEWNEETWLNDPIDLDPMLYSLDEEYPYFPLDYSPVIDAGTIELPDGLTLPEFDLAGNPRIAGNGIDIGCYEWIDGFVTAEEILEMFKPNLTNYPNPFNPETTISMSIPQAGRVKLEVYNIKGQLVKKLMDAQMELGEFTVKWNGKDNNGKKSASGTYIAKCRVNGDIIGTQKMTLLK